MQIKATEIKQVDINTIVPNPRNRNIHSDEQIERLCKMIKYSGFRNPLVISNRSGFLVAGHGRWEASKRLGLTHVPVIYQDFENEAQEYSYIVGDNEIARWAKLDEQGLQEDIKELKLDQDFDLDLFGVENLILDVAEIDLPDMIDKDTPQIGQLAFMVTENQRETINDAIANACEKEELDLFDNNNKNAAALYLICQRYMSERD